MMTVAPTSKQNLLPSHLTLVQHLLNLLVILQFDPAKANLIIPASDQDHLPLNTDQKVILE